MKVINGGAAVPRPNMHRFQPLLITPKVIFYKYYEKTASLLMLLTTFSWFITYNKLNLSANSKLHVFNLRGVQICQLPIVWFLA